MSDRLLAFRKNVGFFSLFRKKDSQKAPPLDDKASPRAKRDDDGARPTESADGGRANAQTIQRDIARATAMKIDAIESEMAADIFNAGEPAFRPKRGAKSGEKAERIQISDGRGPGSEKFQNTLPMMDSSTTEFLMDDHLDEAGIEVSDSEISPIIEEIAILYASDQSKLVEQMLLTAIHDNDLAHGGRSVWWMLFDLYQVTGKQGEFDSLSIDYASKFETSPPAWVSALHRATPIAPTAFSGVTPTVAFAGLLDDSIVKQLQRVQQLSDKKQVFRLEFARVTEVEPSGCALLLRALKTLQKSEHDLIMVGALELAGKIRSIIQIGRRDETDTPWLLLLEILQLLNLEKEFEEASMDYCITFEVSPPPFDPPKTTKVTTAVAEIIHPGVSPDRFMMPPLVAGNADVLITGIKEYAAEYNPVVIDCSRLVRVDFTAAGQLLNGLAPLSAAGKTIEFQDVNHMVAALFHVMGLDSIAKIFPHKY